MRKKAESLKAKIFFNASVILAGLRSPEGGAAKILKWVKEGRVYGFISEIVADEVERNLRKLGLKKRQFEQIKGLFNILPPPPFLSKKYLKIAKDPGDAHLFTSAESIGADCLVSLDQKHVLSLDKKIKDFEILSPGKLIKRMSLGQK